MLAAAISPATLGIVVLILATVERPRPSATAFFAGFAVPLVVLSIVGLLVLNGARSSFDENSSGFGWIDVAMGVLLLITAFVSVLRQGDIDAERQRLSHAPVAAFFGFGVIMMFSSLNTLAVAISLLHKIAVADISAFERAIALALSDLAILLPIVIPIVLYVAAPGLAGRVLPAIRRGVDDHGVTVGAILFTLIGIYLLRQGLSHV